MIEYFSAISFPAVVLAGIVTVFLPCTYPMILGYVALLIGEKKESSTAYTLLLTVWFFIGFAGCYALLGSIAGLFGKFSQTFLLINSIKPTLVIIGGILFIVIGLIMLRTIPLPSALRSIRSVPLPKSLRPDTWSGALAIGIIFALGWSPCIGPVLGGILILAASSGSALLGALYFFLFAFGMLIPLAIIAVIYTRTAYRSKYIRKISPIMNTISGALFILLGVLFIIGDISLLAGFAPPGIFEQYI